MSTIPNPALSGVHLFPFPSTPYPSCQVILNNPPNLTPKTRESDLELILQTEGTKGMLSTFKTNFPGSYAPLK